MNKTINFTDEDIKIIEEHKKKLGVNSFSEAVRSFIRIESQNNNEQDLLTLLNEKVDALLVHIAPKKAGELLGKKKMV